MKILITLLVMLCPFCMEAQHYYFSEKVLFFTDTDSEAEYKDIELHIDLEKNTLIFSDDNFVEPILECRGEGNRLEYLTEYGLCVLYLESDGACSFVTYMPVVGAKKILYRQNKISRT